MSGATRVTRWFAARRVIFEVAAASSGRVEVTYCKQKFVGGLLLDLSRERVVEAIHNLPAAPELVRTAAANDGHGPAGIADPDLFAWLEAASADDLDPQAFGVISMAFDGTVEHDNVAEARMAGLTVERGVGRNFFTSVAPCTDNCMVARRFEAEAEVDALIDYVFTFRMQPANVRLRLLKRTDGRRMYLVVERRD